MNPGFWGPCDRIPLPHLRMPIARKAEQAATPSLVAKPVRIQREVRGNLTCAHPGCAASIALQLYDPKEAGQREQDSRNLANEKSYRGLSLQRPRA